MKRGVGHSAASKRAERVEGKTSAVYLSRTEREELARFSERLSRSASWLLRLAWRVARPLIAKLEVPDEKER